MSQLRAVVIVDYQNVHLVGHVEGRSTGTSCGCRDTRRRWNAEGRRRSVPGCDQRGAA